MSCILGLIFMYFPWAMLTRRPIISLRTIFQGAKRKSLAPHKLVWWPIFYCAYVAGGERMTRSSKSFLAMVRLQNFFKTSDFTWDIIRKKTDNPFIHAFILFILVLFSIFYLSMKDWVVPILLPWWEVDLIAMWASGYAWRSLNCEGFRNEWDHCDLWFVSLQRDEDLTK